MPLYIYFHLDLELSTTMVTVAAKQKDRSVTTRENVHKVGTPYAYSPYSMC